MQQQMRIEGIQPTVCASCGRAPHDFMELSNGRHFMECSRCNVVTAKFPTQAEAVMAWNKNARITRQVTA